MLERLAWAALALVHLMPALALFRPGLITRLYGVSRDADIFLLLQHRAALFFAVLVICLWAMVDPVPRRLAAVTVAISMLSFLALYVLSGSPASLRPIAIADLLALPALAFVCWRAFS